MIVKKMILSDLDGTFLGAKGRLVPENLDAVERFKSCGGLFAFSSGRTEVSLSSVVPDAAKIVNSPCVLANGSYLYDFPIGIYENYKPIDAEKLIPVLSAVARLFPDVGIRINRGRDYLTNKVSPYVRLDLEGYPAFPVVLDFAEMPTDSWSKTVLLGDHGQLEEVRRFIEKEIAATFRFSFSSPHIFEILSPEADKGIQLEYLRSRYRSEGVRLYVIAIGDFENDLGMLRHADLAVCPSNALDCVKEISRAVLCGNDEGAVAELIQKLGSGELPPIPERMDVC